MRIGISEVIVIAILALALIKPEKLNVYARKLGKCLSVVKDNVQKLNEDVIDPVKESVEPITESVNGVREQLDSAAASVSDAMKGGNV